MVRLNVIIVVCTIITGLFSTCAQSEHGDSSQVKRLDRVQKLEKKVAEQAQQIKALESFCVNKTLPFRAMLASYALQRKDSKSIPDFWGGNFWDRDGWEYHLNLWAEEGYNAVVWYGQHELLAGHHTHVLLPLKEFPEARELSKQESEERIAQMQWLMGQAKKHGMKNYLYTHAIVFTKAFAKAHGIDDPNIPVSPTVHIAHTHTINCGVRNELTRRYMEAAFIEFAQVYQDLDGFLACMSENVPGRASNYFAEAVVPAMKKIGRPMDVIAVHWQMPLDEFIENIVPTKTELPGNLWLGLHAYNSEQPTDARPYPFVLEWAEQTGLPTVAALYIANVKNFPFNSPKLAYEFTREMKRIPNFKGYYYWEYSGRVLSPLFRKALARYSKTNEPYSDKPWLDILEKKYGNHQAAEHFLKAYDISGRIILEKDALIWCGHDNFPREMYIPYKFMTSDWQPFSWQTSRVRGQPLQPIWNYARWVARNPRQFKDNNGSDWKRNVEGAYDNYRQIAVWRTEGGSNYDIIPPVHMAKIRQMGQQCLEEALIGLKTVKHNNEEAETVVYWMKAYQLLSSYYEKKVLAAIAALIYADTHSPDDRIEAERLADEAVTCYEEFAIYSQEHIDPILIKIHGRGMNSHDAQGTAGLDKLIAAEKDDRERLAEIFNWPK